MPIIDLGKLKFHWAGSWDTANNYEKDDVVLHRQQAWVGLADSYNQEPEDGSTYWERMAGGLNYRGNFDVAVQYFRNDVVKHGNAVYVVKVDKPTLGTQTTDFNTWDAIGSWSGTSVTENAGDIVVRDADGEEVALAANMKDRGAPEGKRQYLTGNAMYSTPVDMKYQQHLRHSADQELQNETKGTSHNFRVELDDNDNPTGYNFFRRLKGASADYTTEYEVRWNSTDNKFEMREKLPQPDPTTTTYIVTVADDNGQDKFNLDGVVAPTITLTRGSTYIFDQSASSNDTHAIEFKDSSDVDYTDGVTSTGTAGDDGAKTTFVVPMDAPDSLKYACETHGNVMGNTITVVDAIPFEQNKRLSIRRSGHYRGIDFNFHRLRFDVSDASFASDGQTPSNPIRLRFSSLEDGNHNTSATYIDRSSLANDAFFIQNGTAPADDFEQEIYQKAYTDGASGTWYNNRITYNGTPGTDGAFVEVWFDYNDYETERRVHYFEQFNSGAGGILDIEYEFLGKNIPLTLHRWHRYKFEVDTVGTSANHPFYLKTAQSLGTGDQITETISSNGVDNGSVSIWIGNDPANHPDTMYYVSSFDNTDFTNTITLKNKVSAPAIVMPDDVILYDGALQYNAQSSAIDLYWDRFEGWTEFKRLKLFLLDQQSNDDTDQSMYMRFYYGPGDGWTYTRQDASYYYAWHVSYGTTAGSTQAYGNNTSTNQLVWDSGSNNREQHHLEIDIFLTPKSAGNIYGSPNNSMDNDSANAVYGAQNYYDGTDRVFGWKWDGRATRDNSVEYRIHGAGSLRNNLTAGNFYTGVRIYSNSGSIANSVWQLRGYR